MLKTSDRRFVQTCILLLGVQRPVNVQIVNRPLFAEKGDREAAALYWDREDRHFIQTRRGSGRGSFRALVAHELCHAWVVENHPRAKDHGPTFQRCAKGLRDALKGWGYNVGPIYRADCDK